MNIYIYIYPFAMCFFVYSCKKTQNKKIGNTWMNTFLILT